MLLPPIIPTISLVESSIDDEYDSDEEEKAKKRKFAEEIRNRFSHEEVQHKFVVCKMCSEPVAALPTLESHENEREGGFRLTRTFGLAYTLPDNPLFFGCRNLHPVGLCSESNYYIDRESPLCVAVPGSSLMPWSAEVWQNNFESIGGPSMPVLPEKMITRDDIRCSICNFQAHDKRGFLSHINSSSHKEEEKWFISSA